MGYYFGPVFEANSRIQDVDLIFPILSSKIGPAFICFFVDLVSKWP